MRKENFRCNWGIGYLTMAIIMTNSWVRSHFSENNKMEVHKNYFPFFGSSDYNITRILPEDLNISYFPNSGAKLEGAVKMAYKFHNGKRKYILHSNISFHGKLLGA